MAYVRARLLGVNECTQYLNVGRSKIYELLDSGELESVRIGDRRLVPVEALEAFVARLREVTPAQ